ncbi:MAG: ATP-binding protein [Methanomicrobiales archaeon]
MTVEVNLDDLEIYTATLLEKVFANLVKKALRNGWWVTQTRVYYRETAEWLTILCEDYGVGIPLNAKERILRREYYRNTGYDLFLAIKVLSITDLAIRKTSKPRIGARFEIGIPVGELWFTTPTDGM